MSNKVLIVSYHYPPDLAIGAVRPEKFAKHLPDFGYQPVVLTVKEKYYEQVNNTLFKDNDNSPIIRSLKFPNFRDIYLYLKKITPKGLQSARPKNFAYQNPINESVTEANERIKDKLKRYFNSLVVWLPDDKNGWLIPAVWRGLQLIRQHKISVIYTTGPPHSTHLAGLLLKILSRKPWVADFRDPWRPMDKPAFIRSRLSDSIENYFVKMVISNSDAVISVTPEMTNTFQQMYPAITAKKFHTIYNGYDSEDFAQYRTVQKYQKITFAYAGSFYLGRNPEPFLRAVKNLINNRQLLEEQVDVHFIGNCRYLYERSIEEMVAKIGLHKVVRFTDHIPRNEAFMEMARSHILLLFAQNQPLQIPGKLYEYIGLQSTILAVCDCGATKNVLADYQQAVVVSDNLLEAMEEAVLKTIRIATANREQKAKKIPSYIQQFERKKQTNELANVFDICRKN